ncbi:MAG: NADH-quinone oxidoreductase subunit J [Bacteroidota bacterium]
MNIQTIAFFILGLLSIATGILLVTRRNPVSAAVSLIMHFFALAGLYLTLQAQFIAAVQILVYAGAIMVLVVFVIMLLNLGKEDALKERFNPRTALAIALSCALAMEVLLTFLSTPTGFNELAPSAEKIGSPAEIGNVLFSGYIFPFEAISLLLLAAVLGSIILAKRNIED